LVKTSNTDYATGWTTLNLTQYLLKASNLSDLTNVTTARNNLGLGSTSDVAFRSVSMITGGQEEGQTYTTVSVSASNNAPYFGFTNTGFVDGGTSPIASFEQSFFLNKTGFGFSNQPTFNSSNPSSATSGNSIAYDENGLTISAFNTDLSYSKSLTIDEAGIIFPDSTVQTTAAVTPDLSGYAPLASPALTGNPTAPTATFGDNDTSIATTAFVQAGLLGGTANARNLEVYVRNQSGASIPAGSIVYISGATGNRPLITLSQANNDANSAQTMGFTKTTIANNAFGYVIVRGEVENLDTSALDEGDQLYLSPTVAGAYTTTKPVAPQHMVYVGIVIRAHPTLGAILVAVQNGYELAEVHDVLLTTPANNDLLVYELSTDLWKNKSAATLGLATTGDIPAFATNAQVIASSSTSTVISPKDYRMAGLTTNIWAPGVQFLVSLAAGTGSNIGSSVTILSARLLAPNASTAGYASRGFTLYTPGNGGASSVNYSTPSGHAVRVNSASFGSTVAGVKMRSVFGRRLNTFPTPATLAERGYGWEWDFSTRTMNIIAHDGTTLTTTAVTWNPVASRTYEITATSNGAGTISLYVDGTLLGTSSGGPAVNVNSTSIVWWQIEIQNEATAGAQVDLFFQNPKVYTTNG
jgi:hypothetical protein